MREITCAKCVNYRKEWCDIKRDSPDPDLVRDCESFSAATWGDRIRAMTDEELAWFYAKKIASCYGCEASTIEDCAKCWKIWLKEPAEEYI